MFGRSVSFGFAFFYVLLIIGWASSDGVNGLHDSENASILRVALIDYGTIGDHGWTYEGHVGATRMAKHLPYVNLSERESVSDSNASQILREYARNQTQLIFCHSISFGEAIREVAPEYPNVTFMWCGGRDRLAPNVGTYYERIYQAEYLAGIVAGYMTKTNKIAAVEPIANPQVVMAINAFAKGMASVNPQARLHVLWVGSWYDPVKEKQLALSLINEGCDVITHGSDSDATGEAAEETGTHFISLGSDTGRFFPHVFLTGAIWNWEPMMIDIADAVHNGTWSARPQQDWWYGMREGAVELAPLSDLVPEDCKRLVQEKKGAMTSGQLSVFPGMSDEEKLKMNYLENNVIEENNRTYENA
ncbi:MAG TPA: BMP family ABC transporter substrate-binding protein [Methanothrix soehngenii]|nr:BMP family ABC transporter substrate-binding protein [Methanothrix soehngenii]